MKTYHQFQDMIEESGEGDPKEWVKFEDVQQLEALAKAADQFCESLEMMLPTTQVQAVQFLRNYRNMRQLIEKYRKAQ